MLNYFVDTTIPYFSSIKEKMINKVLKMFFGDNLHIRVDKNKIIIDSPINIHCTQTMCLSSDKHIILSSGKTKEERHGYRHSVWLNPDIDYLGRPLMTLDLENPNGKDWHWTIDFDENGNAIIPDGWSIKK